MTASPAAIDADELRTAAREGAVLGGDAHRTIDATVIRACCLDPGLRIDPHGLRLRDVSVSGQLDLAGVSLPVPLRFDQCDFEAPVNVGGAELFELILTGCTLPGLLGNGLRLRRDLDLSRSKIAGAHRTSASTSRQAAVWLCECEIGGRLLCVDTTIDGLGERSVQADRARIAGAVRMIHEFTARGEIRLLESQIGASLDLTGACIEASPTQALDLVNATIGGSLFLIEDPAGRRPDVRGRIDLAGVHIAGRLLIRNADLAAAEAHDSDDVYRLSLQPGVVVHGPRMTVNADVMLTGRCHVSGKVDLFMSDLGSMSVGASCSLRAPRLTALDLSNAQVHGSVWIGKDAVIEGTVRLEGAAVNGNLALHGTLSEPERRSLVSGTAATIRGDLYLQDLRASGGRLNFRNATIGTVTAARAQLTNPAGQTLVLSQATVNGSVRLLDGFRSAGTVAANLSRIEGRLLVLGATFRGPDPAQVAGTAHAIEAISAVIRGGMDLGWLAVTPSVDFTDATTTFLADDPASWPERFTIAGLTYDRFETPQGSPPKPIWDQAARCAWLNRQSTFDSGPYQQAARVFRQHGYVAEAEQILMAERRQARRVGRSAVSWPRRAGAALYAVVGYGFRPLRVLWLLAALLVLVAGSLATSAGQASLRASNGNGDVYSTAGLITATAGPVRPPGQADGDACGDGQVRCFNPVLYAVDTVVPLISLDQRVTWYPDPHARDGDFMLWWLNLATMLGWLLSSIFVLSLARVSRTT